MEIMTAKDAKNGFGRLLDAARRQPVTIQKNGRPVAVMLSSEEYERLEALENAYWLARAKEAEAEGYLGTAEGERMIGDLTDAAD